MLNSVYPLSRNILLSFQGTTRPFLSDCDKRIVFIASAVIVICVASCYMLIQRYNVFPWKVKTNDQDNSKSLGIKNRMQEDFVIPEKWKHLLEKMNLEEATKLAIYYEAMELMFENRGLNWGEWLGKLTSEQKAQRYENLKNMIEKLSEEKINEAVSYSIGQGNNRNLTLLLQAIMEIKNATHRLEIVKMLLEKGADPLIKGSERNDEGITPLEEAQKTNDQELISLIQAYALG